MVDGFALADNIVAAQRARKEAMLRVAAFILVLRRVLIVGEAYTAPLQVIYWQM